MGLRQNGLPSPQVLLPLPAGLPPISKCCFRLLAEKKSGHLSHLFLISVLWSQFCQAGTCWAGESNYCLSAGCKFYGALAKHTKHDLEKYNFSLLLVSCHCCSKPIASVSVGQMVSVPPSPLVGGGGLPSASLLPLIMGFRSSSWCLVCFLLPLAS